MGIHCWISKKTVLSARLLSTTIFAKQAQMKQKQAKEQTVDDHQQMVVSVHRWLTLGE